VADRESSQFLTGRRTAAAADDHGSRPPDGSPPESQPAWRQDFPIDWPQDRYVERRDFVKFLVLTSAAFVVGQMWIALRSSWHAWRGRPLAQRIALVEDVAIGRSVVFHYPTADEPCVLVRLAAAEFVAFSQKCTHLSCAVIPRLDRGIFLCPCHDGIFDIRTGRNLAGPPPRPLPRILLDVRGDAIFATGVEERTS
jgi:Rieske Fe-S protein